MPTNSPNSIPGAHPGQPCELEEIRTGLSDSEHPDAAQEALARLEKLQREKREEYEARFALEKYGLACQRLDTLRESGTPEELISQLEEIQQKAFLEGQSERFRQDFQQERSVSLEIDPAQQNAIVQLLEGKMADAIKHAMTFGSDAKFRVKPRVLEQYITDARTQFLKDIAAKDEDATLWVFGTEGNVDSSEASDLQVMSFEEWLRGHSEYYRAGTPPTFLPEGFVALSSLVEMSVEAQPAVPSTTDQPEQPETAPDAAEQGTTVPPGENPTQNPPAAAGEKPPDWTEHPLERFQHELFRVVIPAILLTIAGWLHKMGKLSWIGGAVAEWASEAKLSKEQNQKLADMGIVKQKDGKYAYLDAEHAEQGVESYLASLELPEDARKAFLELTITQCLDLDAVFTLDAYKAFLSYRPKLKQLLDDINSVSTLSVLNESQKGQTLEDFVNGSPDVQRALAQKTQAPPEAEERPASS